MDFRFADDSDVQDIFDFVNLNYEDEEDPASEYFYRTSASRVSLEDIIKDLTYSSHTLKWVVLETPVPEELIVAAAKVDINSAACLTRVIQICVTSSAPAPSQSSFAFPGSSLKESLFKHIIDKIECISDSFGIRTVGMQVLV